jgi:hypothetical protein
MLEITVEPTTLWDPVANRFYDFKGGTLILEHSLLSISKWEAKWKKPLLDTKNLTVDETMDYIRCMTINRNVDPYIYKCLTDEHIGLVTNYMGDSHTATWFSKKDDDSNDEHKVLTSELIYFYMFSFGIPKDCEKWHFSNLATLLRIFSEENKPKKKKSREQIAAHHRAVNKARRAKRRKH